MSTAAQDAATAARIDSFLQTLHPADAVTVIKGLQARFDVMAALFTATDVATLVDRRIEEMDLVDEVVPGMAAKIAQGLSSKKGVRDHVSANMNGAAEEILVDAVDDAIMSFTGGSITVRLTMHTGDVYSVNSFSDGEHAVEFARSVQGRTFCEFVDQLQPWQSQSWDGPVSGDDVPDMRVVDVTMHIRSFEPVRINQI